MQAILAVTAPFFALVLCGWLAAWRGVLPDSAIPGLNAFVLYFALPCMLFRFGMDTPVLELLNPALLGVYLLCALLMVFAAIAFTLGKRVHLKDAAFGALVAAFPNTGFMGVPLLVALMKLVLHPLLVFVLLTAASALGAGLSGLQIMVVTLTAALPSASNVAMLAERYGADNGRITRIIMSSTVLAFVSFSLLAWVFGVRPQG
ncbi:MAG: AEC family transporter [Rubrivivax sp.]|nr:AEC family transporter [Rubrivivax sp.]